MILYYLGIALQIFCFYHAYTNRKEYYWYAVIFFLPALGSIVYLLIHFYNKNDAEKVGEEITAVFNPSKKINDLIKQLEFADTFANRVALADAYFERSAYDLAIELYIESLDGAHKNDQHVQEQLIASYYLKNDFEKTIELGETVSKQLGFEKDSSLLYLGLAYQQLGKLKTAERYLAILDKRYSNYDERLVLVNFYFEIGKEQEAKELIEELLIEFDHMNKPNRRKYSKTIQQVKKLASTY